MPLEHPAQPPSLLAEAHHRVANNLHLAAAMLRMQAHESDDETVRVALESAMLRLNAIARVHVHLTRDGGSRTVDLAHYFRDVVPDVSASLGTEVRIVGDPSGFPVSDVVATRLGLVVNELAINALKHAYRGRTGGRITLSIQRTDTGRVRIDLRDDGDGLADDFKIGDGAGFGMRLVDMLVRDLGGSLSAGNDGGACFTIELPAA